MRFKPVYRLIVGASQVDITQDVSASTIVRLVVERAMEAQQDRCEVQLSPEGGLQPAVGESVRVDLGFDGTLVRVFTGVVAEVLPEVTAVRVVAYGPVSSLIRLRVDQTYESQSAGQIVSDLAGQARVDLGTVDDGISFPTYAVDGQMNAARHVQRLAERCGFDAYARATGELDFRQFTTTSAGHVFTYGRDLLSYSLEVRAERASSVVVFGESAASTQGNDAASWLTKSFQPGQADGGGGTETVRVVDPSIRTTEAATTRATGVLRRSRQLAKTGTLRALGRPEVRLGDAIRVEQAPDPRLNDTFQVRAIRHRLSRQTGMVTDVCFWGMP